MNDGHKLLVCLWLVGILFGAGCGKTGSPREKFWPGNFLPPQIGENIMQVSAISTFGKDSLWVYIDGGAELFLKNGFIEVCRVDYGDGDMLLVAEVYRFADPDGPRSVLRELYPDLPETNMVFESGILSEASFDFPAGDYLVRLFAYEKSAALPEVLKNAGAEILGLIKSAADTIHSTEQDRLKRR